MAWEKTRPEKEHYDIAVLGVWFGANYGSILNGYSVYRILNNMNKSVLMVNKIGADVNDEEINGTHNARFMETFYPREDISPIYRHDQLGELNKYCDTFLTGSDQIWHNDINRYFHYAFWLGFAQEDRRKISFGTSFGHETDSTPEEKRAEARHLLKRFQALSVREESGVKICRDNYGVKARAIIEPVFCVERTVFDELASTSTLKEESPYILTYILDPSEEKRRVILEYEKQTGKKVINILDGQPSTYQANTEAMNLPNCLPGIGTEDFLKLYEGADFVITDSFHGTAFSLIYNKPFLSIANKKRGYSRFEDILGRFGLMDRLVYDKDLKKFNAYSKFLPPIDYTPVNALIEEAKKDALSWLKEALESEVVSPSPVEYIDVTHQLDESMCTGCSACTAICPTNALTLKPDKLGFYRSSLHYEKCTECGICTKRCPALHLPSVDNVSHPECFEFISSDKDLLRRSSSGGVFSTLASAVLEEGGVVVGASWTKDLAVEHIIIDRPADLPLLQKSKYLQSNPQDVFIETKQHLDAGRKVLFTGTPCQIAGLRAFLDKNYTNLLAIDILCSHAPSTGFFQKYIDDNFNTKIKEYEFRYKSDKHAWSCSHIQAKTRLGKQIVRTGERQDDFQRVFHNHTMCAKHCENCHYQSLPRFGDLTIGDFWGIEKHDSLLNVFDGVSLVLCNNSKGAQLFHSIPETAYRVKKQVPLEWMGGNGHSLVGGRNWISPHRDAFFEAIQRMPFGQAVDYALKPNHGASRTVYTNSRSALQYDSNMFHFRFENDVWEEITIDGKPTLIVKEGKWSLGHYARLPLAKMLEKDTKYHLAVRFKISSQSEIINLHVIDSGSKIFQLIHSEHIGGRNRGQDWIECSIDFEPNARFYDEFMIGAAQVCGLNNYIMFDYISVLGT